MGKISNVYYDEISSNECSILDAGEFYYHYNVIGIDPLFIPGYEEYEERQISLRNRIIGKAIENGEVNKHPKMHTTVFGVSSLKNKAVILTEY